MITCHIRPPTTTSHSTLSTPADQLTFDSAITRLLNQESCAEHSHPADDVEEKPFIEIAAYVSCAKHSLLSNVFHLNLRLSMTLCDMACPGVSRRHSTSAQRCLLPVLLSRRMCASEAHLALIITLPAVFSIICCDHYLVSFPDVGRRRGSVPIRPADFEKHSC